MTDDNHNLFIDAQELLDSNSNPAMIINMDYTIVAVNKAYCEAYSTDQQQIIGENCYRVSHHNDAPCHECGEDCPLLSIKSGETRHDCVHIHHTNNEYPEHVQVRGYQIHDQLGNQYMHEELIREIDIQHTPIDDSRLIGSSAKFVNLLEQAVHAASTDENLLVKGETGAGKDRLSRFIHRQSPRANGPFITLKCVNVHEAFEGSELFGHERRALPGFTGRRRGLIDDADGGTLYLDEISDLPIDLQGRLLQFLETGMYSRVGGKEVMKANVRVITSTRQNPHILMQQNKLRSDLYYRICGIKLKIPALRDRLEDLHSLVSEILKALHHEHEEHEFELDEEAFAVLENYHFPGNIRELQNILKCAANISVDGNINANAIRNCLPDTVVANDDNTKDASFEDMEYQHIKHLLETHHGHRREVADILQISERTLYRKLKKYNLTDTGKNS